MELKAKLSRTGELELPVAFLQEGKSVIAYTPALDLSTSGKNVAQAKKRFAEIVKIFLEDLKENGTLEPVLLSLGWTRGTTSKSSNNWMPPQRILSQEEIRVPVSV